MHYAEAFRFSSQSFQIQLSVDEACKTTSQKLMLAERSLTYVITVNYECNLKLAAGDLSIKSCSSSTSLSVPTGSSTSLERCSDVMNVDIMHQVWSTGLCPSAVDGLFSQ
jgi:hypothetical protein